MTYDTYVFDLDGTLLDTLDDLTDAVNYALTLTGKKTRTKDEVRSFIGNGIAKLIERALGSKERDETFDVTFKAFKEFYNQNSKNKTKPYDGIEELLERLNKAGKTCAIVSNKADGAVQILHRHFFPKTIKIAVGENEEMGIKRKPCPDSLFAVIKRLNADPKKTVYIGDSEVDIQTAKNASLPCISVAWGFKSETFLRENGAEKIVTCPLEILDI